MKKSLLFLALALVAGHSYGQGSGIFGDGIEITGFGNGATNNAVTTIYPMNTNDPGDLPPTGSTATLSTSFLGTVAAPTPNLGTFSSTDQLTLNGGSILTYQYGNSAGTVTDAVTGATINYQIEDAANNYFSGFMPLTLTFNANGIGGAASSMRFSTETAGINLLAGLAPGTYTLNIYNSSTFTQTDATTTPPTTSTGTNYDSNSGNDYGATFTVAPEPGTVSVLLIGFGATLWSVKRFRRVSA